MGYELRTCLLVSNFDVRLTSYPYTGHRTLGAKRTRSVLALVMMAQPTLRLPERSAPITHAPILRRH